jgi:hypothetical protein
MKTASQMYADASPLSFFPFGKKEHMEQVIFVSWSSKLSMLKGGHHLGAP